MKIVLGVGGGIAAYKSCHVLRELRERGHSVRVVPTDRSLEFVGRATWEALSGQPVTTTVFEGVENVEHVRIGQEADLVLIAPATADLLARLRAGRADDLLSATVLATAAPVAVAPAMHTEMWHHPATVENVAVLRQRGIHVLEPASGRLTGKDSGPGRLPEPHDIVEFALRAHEDAAGVWAPSTLAGGRGRPSSRPAVTGASPTPVRNLAGARVVVSAGGTREALDPVRFLGNRSSGKQGIAMARAAAARGANVSLVACNIDGALLDSLPPEILVTPVESTAQLRSAMLGAQPDADVIVMAAAVSDYRPAEAADHKLKKSGDDGMTITLVQNPDVLREMVTAKEAAGLAQTIVGFAAETGSDTTPAAQYAREKFVRKGCDLLVFNDVAAGRAFGTDDNTVTVFGRSAATDEIVELGTFSGDKDDVAVEVTGLLPAAGRSVQ